MKLNGFFIWLMGVALVMFLAAGELRAESPITFSGYLRIRSYITGDYFRAPGSDHKAGGTVTFNRFRISMVFKPNDNVEVRWRFHAPHNDRWGAASGTAATRYVYGILKTDFGNFTIGRISTDIDSAGLQTLGYLPDWGLGTEGYVFDRDSERDGFIYRNDWDNGFGLKVFYAKMASVASPEEVDGKDYEYDRYSVEPYYKWDTGAVSLAIQYDRGNHQLFHDATVKRPPKNQYVSVNPAFMQKFGIGEGVDLTMHAEVKYSKGKYKADDDPETQTYNQDGFGAYLDFVLGYPTGNATLGAWYFDGNGETQLEDGRFVTDDHRHSLVTPGEAFYPFVVFYRGHNVPTGTFGSWGGQETANHWAFALMGNHKLTPNITLNWGVADFRRARSTKLNDGTNVSKHLGTEVDLGLVFKFLEKVQFSSKIGVFNNGSYWKERYGDDNFSGTTWAWGNELIFNF